MPALPSQIGPSSPQSIRPPCSTMPSLKHRRDPLSNPTEASKEPPTKSHSTLPRSHCPTWLAGPGGRQPEHLHCGSSDMLGHCTSLSLCHLRQSSGCSLTLSLHEPCIVRVRGLCMFPLCLRRGSLSHAKDHAYLVDRHAELRA